MSPAWRGGMRSAAALALVTLASAGPAGAAPSTGVTPANPARADTAWSELCVLRPRAAYGSFAAACSSARRIVNTALGRWADSARWTGTGTHFLYRDSLTFTRGFDGRLYPFFEFRARDPRVRGLEMYFERSTDEGPGVDEVEAALGASGWQRDNWYAADGPDGTNIAWVCREALVHIDAQWDGGDPTDSTYVREPGQSLRIQVVPRPRPDPRIPPRFR